MSGKLRQRASANAASSATQTINERILKECHTLYTEPENVPSVQAMVPSRKVQGKCYPGIYKRF